MRKAIQRLCGEERKLFLQFSKSGLIIAPSWNMTFAYLLCVHPAIHTHATGLNNKNPDDYTVVVCLIENLLLLATHNNETERTDSLAQLI